MLGRVKRITDTLGSALSSLTALPVARELARNEYTPRSVHFSANKLDKAFNKHLDDIKPGAKLEYDVAAAYPEGENFRERLSDVLNNPTVFAGSTAPSQAPGISIAPKASRELYAHELGHLASQQTDVGHLIASLRENPKLKNALMASMMTVPGFAAALEEGDNDMDSSLAIAALASAPTLIDEGLATKHGLDIMNKAGMRASIGQRGRLAGGLLSYLAAPVIAGAAGNFVGNQLD